MRVPLVAAVCFAALVPAHAQDRIPEPALRQAYEQCLPACQETNSYAFCSRVCACVTDEVSTHWTMAEFRSKGAALSGDRGGDGARAQIGRIAALCADRTRQ